MGSCCSKKEKVVFTDPGTPPFPPPLERQKCQRKLDHTTIEEVYYYRRPPPLQIPSPHSAFIVISGANDRTPKFIQ
jgi:hypothetical protein